MSRLLRIDELTKVFPGQVALDHVDLTIDAGTTHALVGQNGSGKSTLIKVLAGYHEPTGHHAASYHPADAPQGRPLELGSARGAEEAGIRFVHQDLGLVDILSAAENIAIGAGYPLGRGGRIDWRANSERARSALADIDFTDIDVDVPVGGLAPSQKTAVAIARAMIGWEQGEVNLLVLDEPTASLPGADVLRLFAAVHRLKERGVAILYVSHHLDEIFEIADVVTIFRDGRRVDTLPVADLDHDRLIELMIGHRVERGRQEPRTATGAAGGLTVRGLAGGSVAGVDLRVEPGEIVAVAGITGSGREMLVPLVTGQLPSDGGDVIVGDAPVPNYAPGEALRLGMAFLAADRTRQGVFPTESVRGNLTISDLRRHWRRWRLHGGSELAETRDWVGRLSVKTAGVETPIAALSGGNQQKVLFGRSLRLTPSVLVLDEPTRGIDVGAKEEIHTLIDHAAADGAAVLVASTDTDEIVRLAHRVVVMRNGVVAAVLTGDQISVPEIERAQLQSASEVSAP